MSTKRSLIDNDIFAAIAAAFWVVCVAVFAFYWAYSLMTPTKKERETAAFRCALMSERTDLAIAECFIEHGLEVPDDI